MKLSFTLLHNHIRMYMYRLVSVLNYIYPPLSDVSVTGDSVIVSNYSSLQLSLKIVENSVEQYTTIL